MDGERGHARAGAVGDFIVMKVPDIRLYLPGDFPEVVELLEKAGFRPPSDPAELWGLALVARDDKEPYNMIGFVWALVAEGSPVAYIDYFAVHPDHRKSMAGAFLWGTMMRFLQRVGIRKVIAVTPQENRTLLRAMMKRGAEHMGLFHVLTGDLEESVDDEAADAAVTNGEVVGGG